MDDEVYYDGEPSLPLATMACALKKLEEFQDDMCEILEDQDIDNLTRQACEGMRDQARSMMYAIVALAGREITEEEFIAQVDMMSDMSET